MDHQLLRATGLEFRMTRAPDRSKGPTPDVQRRAPDQQAAIAARGKV